MKAKKASKPRTRNPLAKAIRLRAGNAAVAVAVDTRVRAERVLKGRGSYRRCDARAEARA